MALQDIDKALIAGFDSLALGVPVSYPNMDFVPPTGAAWIELVNIPVLGKVVTMGDSGEDDITGYFQVGVNGPINQGSSAVATYRESVRAFYRLGKQFTFNGQVVRITYAKLSPVIRNGAYASGVIQLFWSARIQRSTL